MQRISRSMQSVSTTTSISTWSRRGSSSDICSSTIRALRKAIGDEKILAMEAEYSRVAHRFRDSRGSWTSASIADRAEDVGSGDLYRLAYGTLSGITHGDIVGMQAHATPEGIDVEPGPSEQWIHESLAVGHAAVANVFRTFNEVASLNMDTSIDAIHAGYVAAWPSQKSDTAPQTVDAIEERRRAD